MEAIGTGPKYRESKLRALKEEITQIVPGATRYVPKGQCWSGRFFVSSGSAALFDSNLPLTATPRDDTSTVSPATATIGFISGSVLS
jgi:hypothetical protein